MKFFASEDRARRLDKRKNTKIKKIKKGKGKKGGKNKGKIMT
jgi:hypothetical protein